MHGIDFAEDANDDSTVFRDVIMLALLGFVTIVILLLPHINPPTVAEATTDPPGNVLVEVRWPDEFDSDVDLWVQAPGDLPVGYSNTGGDVFNLLRDDLGHSKDVTNVNYEVAYSRGTPAGEYTVNLHLYRNNAGRFPIPVTVQVSLKNRKKGPPAKIALEQVEMRRIGEEQTIVRFSLDDEGNLVPGSVHHLPRGLRTSR